MGTIAESNVIGCLITDESCISDIYGVLTPEMFENKLYGKIYHEYQRAFDRGEVLTLPALEQRIRDDSLTSDMILNVFKQATNGFFSTSYVKEYAKSILDEYKTNRLTNFLKSTKIMPNNYKEQMRLIAEEIELLQGSRTEKSQTLSGIAKKYKDGYFKEREITPTNLGFSKLDDLLGGLEGGDMIVIGARPAVGKSALVTQITSNLAKQGKRVGFYNLEMKDKQMYERFVVNESGIGLTRLRRAIRFLGDEKERFDKANEILEKAENIIITSDGAKKVSEIYSESKNMDYDIIIIDYLQLLEPEGTYRGNRTAEVGEISRHIKQVAMKLNIPIIALSQLNRVSELKETKEPTMAELREAGNIEQDASVIILMWNLDENDRSKKGCKVEKQRQGECGKVVMRFNGNLMRFEETNEDIKTSSEWKPIKDNNPFD